MSTEEFADDRRPLGWSMQEDGIDLLELFDEGAPSRRKVSTSNQHPE